MKYNDRILRSFTRSSSVGSYSSVTGQSLALAVYYCQFLLILHPELETEEIIGSAHLCFASAGVAQQHAFHGGARFLITSLSTVQLF